MRTARTIGRSRCSRRRAKQPPRSAISSAPWTVSGRRAGLRFDAALGVTTEALLFLGELDPERIGASLEYATHYEPTPVAEAEALLDASPLAPRDATFVDLGAGLGRVVLLAARRPFRAVIGVEISPALAEIARENLRDAHDPRRVARDVRVVAADAATWDLPRGDVVLFLYNPFRGPVLEAVLERAASHEGEVVILYHTAVERAHIDAHGAFTPAAEFPFGVLYVRATPPTRTR